MSDDVLINIRAKDLASGAFASASNAAKGFQKTLTGVVGSLGLGLGAGLFLKDAVKGMFEAKAASRQLDAVIKSTGGVAGVTAASIANLADQIQRTTNFEDDLVVRASAVMLTFTKLGKDVFPEAMKAAVDMSAALGTDLQGSVLQVGKALNDPIKGITALSRAGVSFTDQQKEMIKSLVNANEAMKAQKIILQELKTEFGGAAEANSDPFTRAWNSVKDRAEDIAGVFERLQPGNWRKLIDERYRRIAIELNADKSKLGMPGSHWSGGHIVQRLGGMVGRNIPNVFGNAGRMAEEIGFRIMPKVHQAFADLRAKARVDAAMNNPNEAVKRALFAKPSTDLFDWFKQQAAFIDKPAAESRREQISRGGTFGLSSRFLSTGVGFDPSTQTAKNTANTVEELRALRKDLKEAKQAMQNLDRKQPNVVGKI